MQFTEYIEATRQTWRTEDDRIDQIVHAAMGLANEVGEYLAAPSPEELGDVAYYHARLCDLVDRDIESGGNLGDPTQDAAALLGWAKKLRFQQRDDDTEVGWRLGKIRLWMMTQGNEVGDGIQQVRRENIEKLTGRYPDGFEEGGGDRETPQVTHTHEPDAPDDKALRDYLRLSEGDRTDPRILRCVVESLVEHMLHEPDAPDRDSIREEIRQLRQHTDQRLDALRQQVDALKGRVGDAESALAALETDTSVSAVNACRDQIDDLDIAIEALRMRVDHLEREGCEGESGDTTPDASEPEGDTIPVGGCAEGWRVKPEEGPIVFIESARKRRDKQIWVSPEGVLGGVYWPASTPVRVIDKGGE